MEFAIKCSKCQKKTMKHRFNLLFYTISDTKRDILVKNSIICPKCKKDISDGQCLVKQVDFSLSTSAAIICLMAKQKVPAHLKGAVPIKDEDYERCKQICKARLKLVDRF